MRFQRTIRKLLSKTFEYKGYLLIPQYEYNYLSGKNLENSKEIMSFFLSQKKLDLSHDDNRYKLMSNLYGTSVIESLYIIYYLTKCIRINGDICEFGIANGATSALLANEIKSTRKRIWLYDSFQGLSNPSKEDSLINDIFGLGSMNKYKGSMSYETTEVMKRLKDVGFPKNRTKIIKGFIEETSQNVKNFPNRIAFAYIDFDLYEPIKVALEKIHPLLSSGGVIIVDDYEFFSSGVKKAVDNFISSHRKVYTLIKPKYSEGHFVILIKK